jgi:hypothetical protein
VTVELAKDDSKYGMAMPGEFAEVLRRMLRETGISVR